jgi:hypothetical protein
MRLRFGASGAERLCALGAPGRVRPLDFTVRAHERCLEAHHGLFDA